MDTLVPYTKLFRSLGAGIDIAAALDAQSALDTVLLNTIQLSSETLGTAGLGGLRVAGKSIHVASDLAVANGGEISMRAETIDVDGNITARSGIIALDRKSTRLNSQSLMLNYY